MARDVTGWPARAVEYFALLSTTQNLNHLRMDVPATVDLRESATLRQLAGPFEKSAHTLEVRRIAHGAGRYNIPSIGLHLWRLFAYPLRRALAHEVEGGEGLHYTFSPLGNDMPLFAHPRAIANPFERTTERNVPDPIRRRVLHEQLDAFYGDEASIGVWEGEDFIRPEHIAVCDLTDWHHSVPAGRRIAIDPELGRIAFANEPESDVRVLYHYGFSADIGGGPYNRLEAAEDSGAVRLRVGSDPSQDGGGQIERFATIGEALGEWISLPVAGRPSIIEIDDNSTYVEALPDIELPEGTSLTIRAANRKRPTLLLTTELHVEGGERSEFALSGLLIANQRVRVSGQPKTVRISHCTFVPGHQLSASGEPLNPGEASLRIEATSPEVEINRSIIGPMQTAVDAQVKIYDSIVDANDVSNPAYQGLQDGEAGGVAEVQRATIIGTVHATEIRLGSDTIFLGTVEALKRQQGCLRFSHVPFGSVVPRRFRCQPVAPDGASAEELERLARTVSPQFTSLRYGDPGYCQLTPHAPSEIRRGAEDESEMGAFSLLKQSQREDSLRIRLGEYLRLGMEAGILYVT